MRPALFLFIMAASPVASAHHVADDDGGSPPPQSRQQNGAPAVPRDAAASPKSEPAPTHTYCFQNAAGKVHCAVLPGGSH